MYLMSHVTQGLAAGSYGLEGAYEHIGGSLFWVCSHCRGTSVPHKPPCFYLCLETEVQTLKSLLVVFVNGLANFKKLVVICKGRQKASYSSLNRLRLDG